LDNLDSRADRLVIAQPAALSSDARVGFDRQATQSQRTSTLEASVERSSADATLAGESVIGDHPRFQVIESTQIELS
jgi:hypothetical protein